MSIKRNVLIAEFMGWHFQFGSKGNPYKVWNPLYFTADPPPDDWAYSCWLEKDFEGYIEKELRYDSSWDSLIPVCHKWDLLDSVKLQINNNDYIGLCDLLDSCVTCYDIDLVYNQIVENIKWFNLNCHQQGNYMKYN